MRRKRKRRREKEKDGEGEGSSDCLREDEELSVAEGSLRGFTPARGFTPSRDHSARGQAALHCTALNAQLQVKS
jgi:hypothetical protein